MRPSHTSALALLLSFASLACPAAAAGLRELTIPIEPELVGKRAFSDDPLVSVDAATYRDLAERYRASHRPQPAAPLAAPIAFSAVAASYQGTVAGGTARFRASLEYHALDGGTHRLPIAFPDVALDTVTVTPAVPFHLVSPGAEEPVVAVMDAKGPVTLEVVFAVPVVSGGGRNSLGFRIPDLPVQRVEMLLPPGASSPSICGKPSEPERVRAQLGASPVLEVEWFVAPRDGVPPRPPPSADADVRAIQEASAPRLAASISSLFTIGDETLSVHHEIDLLVTRGRASSIDLELPAGVELQSLEGPLVADWRPGGSTGRRSVHVRLKEALRGETTITLASSVALGGRERIGLPFPTVTGASRQHGVFGISSYAAVEFEKPVGSGTPAQSMDPGELPGRLVARSAVPLLLAGRHGSPAPEVSLRIRRPPSARVLTHLAETANAVTILTETDRGGKGTARGITTFTKIVLQYVNASRKTLAFNLDPKARITGCFVDSRASAPSVGAKPGEYLLPVPRSRVVNGKLASYALQITYQLDVDQSFAESGSVAYALPAFDTPIADYAWKVFTPEKYRFLRFRGNLEDTFEDSEFVMVSAAKWLFDRILYDLAARLFVLGLLVAAVRFVFFRGSGTWRERLPAAGKSFLTLGTIVFIAGIFAAISVPNFRAARERANFRGCFANQKTIAGAIEMFNLDNNTCRTDIGEELLQELVQGGYLQSVPRDPGQGTGYGSSYFRTPDGNGIACRNHGSISGGPARLYGCTPVEPVKSDSPDVSSPGSASSVPRNDRTNPINFRIPRTGQFTLLLRGFMPENGRPRFDARYHSLERYGQLRTACWVFGALLALLLVWPARILRMRAAPAAPAASAAALLAFLVLVLALDTGSPALAADTFGAWVAALTVTLLLAVSGGRMRRLLGRFEEGGDF